MTAHQHTVPIQEQGPVLDGGGAAGVAGSKTGSIWRNAVIVGALLSIGAVIGFSANSLLSPPPQVPGPTYILAESSQTTIERSINTTTDVAWPAQDRISIPAEGTVTKLPVGKELLIDSGTQVLEVDLKPVVFVTGETPSFRELKIGDMGRDVRQLQVFLQSKKYLSGKTTGMYDESTENAVRSWQRKLGITPTGTVDKGMLIFRSDLPFTAELDATVAVGNEVSRDRPATLVKRSGEPEFRLTLTPIQSSWLPETPLVTLTHEDHTWNGVLQRSAQLPEGEQSSGQDIPYVVSPAPGHASVCHPSCEVLPLFGDVKIPTQVTIVPRQEGVGVPATAVKVSGPGKSLVIMKDGEERAVEVKGVADGIAIVEGLPAGAEVRVETTSQ